MIKLPTALVVIACFLFACNKVVTNNPNQVNNNQTRTDSISGILYKNCGHEPDAGDDFTFQVMEAYYNVYAPVYQQTVTTDSHGRFKATFTFKYESGSSLFVYSGFANYNMVVWPFASTRSNLEFVENDTAF